MFVFVCRHFGQNEFYSDNSIFDYKNGKWGWYDPLTDELIHETSFRDGNFEIRFEKVIPYPPLPLDEHPQYFELSFSQYKLLILILINIFGKHGYDQVDQICDMFIILREMVSHENISHTKLKLPPWGYKIITYLQNFLPLYNEIQPEIDYDNL